LFEHWGLLKKWIDEYIIDIRFHWKLSEAAKEWEFHNKAEGLLWYQSPNFDKLQDFYERNYLDMMDIQVKFYEKSKIKKEGEEAVRIQREISRAAMNWKVNHKAKDLLWWYSPELDILKKFYKKNHQNMTLLEKEFYEESRKEKENKDVEIILTKIKKRIMEAKNLNEIMIDMIAEIAEVFNSERAIIYIYDREKKELMSRQLIYEKEISEMRTKMTRDQIKWIQDQTACCVSKGILDVPISFQKIFMGVVRFMNKKDGTAYSRIDERAAKELSQHIGIAVNNILKESKINTPPLLHKYSLLIQRNFISIQEINVAMEEWKSKNSKMSFYMYLITKYNIPKKELLESFAKYYNVPYMEYDVDTPIRKDLIKTLGVPFLKMNYWIPLRNQGKKIIIAIDDPEDCIKIEGIKRIFPNRPIEFRISLKEDILDFIRLFTEGKKER